MKHFGLMMGLAGLLLGAAHAQAGVYISDPHHRQIHENLANQSQWGAVGVILDDRGALCSGSLITGTNTATDNQWVLTAAHCVDFASSMTFGTDDRTIAADSWFVPDTWTGTIGDGNDIALIKLATPLTGVESLRIATRTPTVGEEVAVIGFGTHGLADFGPTESAGQRRLGHQLVESVVNGTVTGQELYFDMDFVNPLSDGRDGNSALPLEYLIAPGDSGGPDVILGEIHGVHSWGFTPSSFGMTAASTMVFPWLAWINDIIDNGGNTATIGVGIQDGSVGDPIFTNTSFFGEGGPDNPDNDSLYAASLAASADFFLANGIAPWEISANDDLYLLGATTDIGVIDTSIPEPGTFAVLITLSLGLLTRRK